jgi:hypothetical protein
MCRIGSVLLILLAGCDFFESATARVVVAGIVARSPELQLAGQYSVPGETIATVWLGERQSETSTEEPSPIAGADVSLEFDSTRLELEDGAERGLYLKSSLDDAKLEYRSTSYVFTALTPGSDADFGGAVAAPTELSPAAVRLSPAPTESVPGFPEVQRHPKSTAIDVSWQEQFGRRGYLSVFRANAGDPSRPELVFDSRPKSALEWIELVAGNPPEKLTVPADAFSRDGVYAVVLVALERGDVLPSTFIGSPILAGSGAVRFLAVGNVSL